MNNSMRQLLLADEDCQLKRKLHIGKSLWTWQWKGRYGQGGLLIRSPDGQTHTITVPALTTPNEVREYIIDHLLKKPKKRPGHDSKRMRCPGCFIKEMVVKRTFYRATFHHKGLNHEVKVPDVLIHECQACGKKRLTPEGQVKIDKYFQMLRSIDS